MDYCELYASSTGFGELVQLARRTEEPVTIAAGVGAVTGCRRWLLHVAQPPTSEARARILLVGCRRSDELDRRLERLRTNHPPTAATLYLVLGRDQAAGHLAGLSVMDGVEAPLRRFCLVGPGLAQIDARGNFARSLNEMQSRSRGALGGETFDRIRSLHIALIGCGRSGSILAEGLASLGFAELTLIDPDTIELHNLGEMSGVTRADVGRAKCTCLAAKLQQLPTAAETTIRAAISPVESSTTLRAVKPADVLISCPDRPSARLAVGALAALYLKPILDIGTGILYNQGTRLMGADVRWVVPGRCLACFGGVAGLAEARAALVRGEVGQRIGDFQTERLGSLRSLNAIAVSLGQTLLEQYVEGSLGDSTWLQVNVDSNGRPRVSYQSSPPLPGCPLCSLTAHGDQALAEIPSLFMKLM